MSRRALAFLVGLVVVSALIAATELVSLPYVVLYPAPPVNSLGASGGQPVIQVTGRQTYPAGGHLYLAQFYAYGGPDSHLNLLTALGEWLSPGHSVVPQGEYAALGLPADAAGPDAAASSGLQDEFTAAVLRQLKIPFREAVVVSRVLPGYPAARVLRPGDVLAAVNGRPVTSLSGGALTTGNGREGQPATVTVERRGVRMSFRVARKPGPAGQPVIGIEAEGSFMFPFTVRVGVGLCPDGGCDLMLALALLDKLAPLNLADGASVAGAGGVDDTGGIEPVASLGMNALLASLLGKGVTVFLTPAADCAQALRTAPPGLRLIKVSTLDGAVSALEALRAGRPAPTCA